ncbi:Enoyl-[acyl-carrier-protein] reductase [NADH] FabI [Candidatus Hepatincolaceae symbiont of Richtersius coronifer]
MEALMKGKKGLITGVVNEYSIAWAIAKKLANQGAQLAFTYPNDKIEKRIKPLAQSLGCSLVLECDVTKPETMKSVFNVLEKEWGEIDFLVHAIAFSDKNELKGKYLDTTLPNFLNTLHISCFSLTELCQYAVPLMKKGGSIVTLSYYGAEKILPNYNVMGIAKAALECSVRYLAEDLGKLGIRVNTISAGPIKTLAASGIGDFNYILKWNAQNSPLRKNITQDQVGDASLYLLSDLSSGVTGSTHYVDNGYNIVGMKAVDAEDLQPPNAQ